MNLTPLSQHDPRWSHIHLGYSSSTIGDDGCTITALAMKLGITPDVVNERLKAVDGFADSSTDPFNPQKNLIIWKKIEEAFPGTHFAFRYYDYDNNVNEIIKQNLPCLVEVDASPIGGMRHWVLYIGNQQILDPFDGKQKPTSTYQALGASVIIGEYTIAPEPVQAATETTYKGLDLTNIDSVKAAIDSWYEVAHGAYIPKIEHDRQISDLKNSLPVSQTQEDVNYTQLKALGYTTIDDVNKALASKDSERLALIEEVAIIRDRNSKLSEMVSQMEGQDSKAAELAQKAADDNRELQDTLEEIAKVTGVTKATKTNIVAEIFNLKDLADRLLAKNQQDKKIKQDAKKKPTPKKQDSDTMKSIINIFLGRGVKNN